MAFLAHFDINIWQIQWNPLNFILKAKCEIFTFFKMMTLQLCFTTLFLLVKSLFTLCIHENTLFPNGCTWWTCLGIWKANNFHFFDSVKTLNQFSIMILSTEANCSVHYTWHGISYMYTVLHPKDSQCIIMVQNQHIFVWGCRTVLCSTSFELTGLRDHYKGYIGDNTYILS